MAGLRRFGPHRFGYFRVPAPGARDPARLRKRVPSAKRPLRTVWPGSGLRRPVDAGFADPAERRWAVFVQARPAVRGSSVPRIGGNLRPASVRIAAPDHGVSPKAALVVGVFRPHGRSSEVASARRPQRAINVQVAGLRLCHHAVEIPARGRPEMPRILGRDHRQRDCRRAPPTVLRLRPQLVPVA